MNRQKGMKDGYENSSRMDEVGSCELAQDKMNGAGIRESLVDAKQMTQTPKEKETERWSSGYQKARYRSDGVLAMTPRTEIAGFMESARRWGVGEQSAHTDLVRPFSRSKICVS